MKTYFKPEQTADKKNYQVLSKLRNGSYTRTQMPQEGIYTEHEISLLDKAPPGDWIIIPSSEVGYVFGLRQHLGTLLTVEWEATDTFGGQANYSWVKRGTFKCSESMSDVSIIRRVKKALGWTGHPCRVQELGIYHEIRPRGVCQVCFINFSEG